MGALFVMALFVGGIVSACKKAAAKKKADEWMQQGHAPMPHRSNWKAKAAGLGAKVLLSARCLATILTIITNITITMREVEVGLSSSH